MDAEHIFCTSRGCCSAVIGTYVHVQGRGRPRRGVNHPLKKKKVCPLLLALSLLALPKEHKSQKSQTCCLCLHSLISLSVLCFFHHVAEIKRCHSSDSDFFPFFETAERLLTTFKKQYGIGGATKTVLSPRQAGFFLINCASSSTTQSHIFAY